MEIWILALLLGDLLVYLVEAIADHFDLLPLLQHLLVYGARNFG